MSEDERVTRIRARLGAGWTRDELLLLQEDEIERLRAEIERLRAREKARKDGSG